VKLAARRLRTGGVVAYPTEAVYGLGCDPLDHTAFVRLLALKRRPDAKGVILIAADETQLAPFVTPLSKAATAHLRGSWPGPVTWIVPAASGVPGWLTGGRDTVAVRVTAHPLAAALCRAFGGALVSTSANRTGQPPARTALKVRQLFGNRLDGIVVGPLGGLARPTTIRDARTGSVIRQ
jgi:L-threonylcarbamoyladenylate synthase